MNGMIEVQRSAGLFRFAHEVAITIETGLDAVPTAAAKEITRPISSSTKQS
jgi:hypothetical protein